MLNSFLLRASTGDINESEQRKKHLPLRRVSMPKTSSSGKSADLLKQAIASIDEEIKALTAQRDQLAKLVGGGAAPAPARRGRPAASPAPAGKKAAKKAGKKRVFSAATKKKLKDAAKARWARVREEKAKAAS
jgi:hypothetical protein